MLYWSMIFIERFEDSKVVTRSRKSKDRQCNGQREKNTKGQTMIYKTLHKNLKIEQHEPNYKLWVNSGAPEVLAVPGPLVTPVVLLSNDTNIM